MLKKVSFLFAILMLAACFLSYKLGSSPAVLAKSRPAQEQTFGAPPPLPAPPAESVLSNYTGTGIASVTKTGAAGVQHVVDWSWQQAAYRGMATSLSATASNSSTAAPLS